MYNGSFNLYVRAFFQMGKKPFIPQSDRLIFRDFSDSDWLEVFAYQSNPLYLQYYPWNKRKKENVMELITRFINWSKEIPRTKFQFALILKDKNKLIGNCGIRKSTFESQEGELGCELDPNFWKQGYAYEAVSTILKYSFEELKLHRVWITTKAENKAAIKLVKKLRMRKEGRLREQEWLHDHWGDSLIYSILSHEWKMHQ